MPQSTTPAWEDSGAQRHAVWWILLVLVSACALGLETPARLALGYPPSTTLLWMDWLITGVFIADLGLYCFSCTRVYSRCPWRTPMLAGRTGWLLVDLLVALPWQLLPLAPVWSIVRLAKLCHVTAQLRAITPLSRRLAAMRAWGLFGLRAVLLLHWLACGWITLGGVPAPVDLVTQYTLALYWCISTTTTVGYGDITAHTNAQAV